MDAAAIKTLDFDFNFATQQIECEPENTICNVNDYMTYSGVASDKSVTFVENFRKGYPAEGITEIVYGAFAGNDATVG